MKKDLREKLSKLLRLSPKCTAFLIKKNTKLKTKTSIALRKGRMLDSFVFRLSKSSNLFRLKSFLTSQRLSSSTDPSLGVSIPAEILHLPL